jgi:hypothetical protein
VIAGNLQLPAGLVVIAELNTVPTLTGTEVINENNWPYHEKFASRIKFEMRSS